MDPIRKNLLDSLNFSASEKRGMAVALLIVLLLNLIPHAYDLYSNEMNGQKVEISFRKFRNRQVHLQSKQKEKKIEVNLHDFDPNVSTSEELKALGFPTYLADRIVKYRKYGRRFGSAEELMKIYGMEEDLLAKVRPYIHIKEEIKTARKHDADEPLLLELNSADSTSITAIRGIGAVYTRRIVKYRNSLGGFVNKEQLKEVYGIGDSLYRSMEGSLVVDTSAVKKIPLNSVGRSELQKHPYFRKHQLASAIINFRKQHGKFKSREELKEIHIINDSIFSRISPYLSLE